MRVRLLVRYEASSKRVTGARPDVDLDPAGSLERPVLEDIATRMRHAVSKEDLDLFRLQR